VSTTLLESWLTTLEANPEATGIIDSVTGQSWSRLEIDELSTNWAQTFGSDLHRCSVAFSESNGIEWLRVFLGILKANAVAVPLDPGEPFAAQQRNVQKIRARYLWHSREGLIPALHASSRPHRHRDSRCLIKLTSGSTGEPRPLSFKDEQMLADGRSICSAMHILPEDLNVGIIPWGHSYGLGNLIVPLLTQGTAILTGLLPLPHVIAQACMRWRPTIFPAVPPILKGLAESNAMKRELSSVHTVITAGATMPQTTARLFYEKFGLKIHSFYGSSETGGIAYDVSGDRAMTDGSVGLPLPQVQLTFSSHRRFTVSGPAVYTIGNRRPGNHRMPDLAQLGKDGALQLEGRVGRFIKIAGRRLNLAEIEQTMCQLTEVHIKEARVTPHPNRQDALAAVVTSPDSKTAIINVLRQRVASWKVPKKLIILDEFPRTARGKIDIPSLDALL
jgi:long-chain acyl-CoA synthetase